MATSEPTATLRRSSWRTWARRLSLGFAAVLVLLVLVVWGIASNLDAPSLKNRLQVEVRQASGLDITWAHAGLSLRNGLVLEDVHVRSPMALQPIAADFIHITRAELSWSPGQLLRGERPLLDSVVIDAVEVTLVDDVQQGTTTGLLWPASSVPSKPGPGLSSTLASVFAGEPWVRSVRVDRVKFAQRKVDHGQVVDSTSVDGLSAQLDGWQLKLGSLPLQLDVKGHQATLTLSVDAEASSGGARLHVVGTVEQQNFEPKLTVKELLSLDARVRFDVAAHQVGVELSGVQVMDHAATATVALVRGDDGVVVINDATLNAELVRAAASATALGVPVRAATGVARVKVHELRVLPEVKLLAGAELAVHVEGDSLELRDDTRLSKVLLDAQVDAAEHVTLTGEVDGLSTGSTAVQTLRLKGDGARGQAQATVKLAGVKASAVGVATTEMTLQANDLVWVGGAAFITGRAEVIGTASGVRVLNTSVQAALEQVKFTLGAATDGKPPYAATAKLEGQLQLAGAGAKTWFDGPIQLDVTAHDVLPAGTGAAEARLTLPDVAVLHVDARRTDEQSAHLEATVDATTLAALETVVAMPPGWHVAWAGTSASLTTRVDAESLSSVQPRFTHVTSLELKGLSGTSPRGKVMLPSVQLSLDAHGTTADHAGTLSLVCARCEAGPVSLLDERIVATFDVDSRVPRARVQLESTGVGPVAQGLFSLAWVKAEQRTTLEAQLTLGHLGALAPVLHGTGAQHLDLSHLHAEVTARGSVAGRELSLDTLRGTADAELSSVTWEDAERSLDVPVLTLSAKVDSTDAGQFLNATAKADSVDFALGEKTATLTAAALQFDAQTTRGSRVVKAQLGLTLREVVQDFVPAYVVGDVKVNAAGGRDAEGLLSLARSTVTNGAAGTSLWVEGALAPDPTHSKVSLQAELTQDLSLAWRDVKQFQGKGQAVMRMGVHSGDLRLFHTSGSLVLDDADVRVPGAFAEGIQGELPFAVDLTWDTKGVRPVRTAKVNPYALLRFQDQHPLIKDQSFLTMRTLTTPQVTIAPFAANVQLSQSVLYMSQLELGMSGGAVTGELLVDMNEKDPRVRANVRATGIRSAEGDVFSGNAALAMSLRDHSVDGRAEVLQISRRQLLSLLDLQDPHHTSASTNRIRQVMDFGYPDRLHILFNHGFASAKVTFGGAASLVQLDELRGIPIESLVDRYVFNSSESPEGM